VGLHQPQLQGAKRQNLLCDLLAQTGDVEIFHIPQQVLNTCSGAVTALLLPSARGNAPISSASAAPISHWRCKNSLTWRAFVMTNQHAWRSACYLWAAIVFQHFHAGVCLAVKLLAGNRNNTNT
jgi:hypothetical protein